MKRIAETLSRLSLAGSLCIGGLFLSACVSEEITKEDFEGSAGGHEELETTEIDFSKRKTIFGEGGLNLFGDSEPRNTGGALGVNSYLWRASLDTISFMPVNSADPFGGVIITDWHSPTEAPSERFKLNVYILGRALRADGVRVAVFRQVQDQRGAWKDAGVPEETGTKIEDAILFRARQLRNQNLQK
ncbi:MAG: DUF3576 domain-containing protein [Proteobacteria bacterium]|nr:DUF3576 domain-containing protein [Pseudomonadota bacterium]